MKLERESEFAVGDVVSMKINPEMFVQIIEVHSVTCNAGTQFDYVGRQWMPEKDWFRTGEPTKRISASNKIKLHELEVIPKVEDESTDKE